MKPTAEIKCPYCSYKIRATTIGKIKGMHKTMQEYLDFHIKLRHGAK